MMLACDFGTDASLHDAAGLQRRFAVPLVNHLDSPWPKRTQFWPEPRVAELPAQLGRTSCCGAQTKAVEVCVPSRLALNTIIVLLWTLLLPMPQ